jgi:hypothetical protein
METTIAICPGCQRLTNLLVEIYAPACTRLRKVPQRIQRINSRQVSCNYLARHIHIGLPVGITNEGLCISRAGRSALNTFTLLNSSPSNAMRPSKLAFSCSIHVIRGDMYICGVQSCTPPRALASRNCLNFTPRVDSLHVRGAARKREGCGGYSTYLPAYACFANGVATVANNFAL